MESLPHAAPDEEEAAPRILRRYLASGNIQPEELAPFGITETDTGAKVSGSSVRNFNTFNVYRQKEAWIKRLTESPCEFLKTNCNLDEMQLLAAELDKNPDLVGVPLREPDPYYLGQDTYVTVSSERELHRFSANPSLGLFLPSSEIRQAAISIACSIQFQAFIVAVVILDFLALVSGYASDPIVEIGGEFFFAVYCAELVVKVIAYGFVFDQHSFLRSGHSVVEIIVVISNVLPMFFPVSSMFKQLRVIRVVRLFRLIGTLNFTRRIMKALVSSIKDLVPVFVLFLAMIGFFSLVSLVFYRATLLGKCVNVNYTVIFNATGQQEDIVTGSQLLHASYLRWTDNSANWQPGVYGAQRCPVITRSASWWTSLIDDRHLRKCPEPYTCLQTRTGNPNMGFSNYDTLMLSMLSTFRLLCQDWWDNLYVQVALANGGHATTLFFLALIFLGSHYVINLVLSTITLAYQRNEPSTQANQAELSKLAVIMQVNRDNHLRRQVELYNILVSQGRTGICEPRYLNKLPEEVYIEPQRVHRVTASYLLNYRDQSGDFLPDAGHNPEAAAPLGQAARPQRRGQSFAERAEQVLRNIAVRRRKHHDNLPVETLINFIILMNVIEMLVVTPVQKQSLQATEGTNLLYTIIFTLEAVIKIRYQKTHYLKRVMNRFDLIIVVICLVEILLPYNNSRLIMILRMTRFLRLFKLARINKKLEKLITIVLGSLKSEMPLIILSSIIVIISAGIGMVMFQDTYKKYKEYQKPTINFVNIYNSILLVFRIMCGEWIENLWVCMKIMESMPEKGFCVAYFLTNQVIVSLIIFQLYIGILLNKFSESRAKAAEPKGTGTGEEVKDNGKKVKEKQLLEDRIKDILTKAFGINFGIVRHSSIVSPNDSAFTRFRHNLSAIASNSSSWYANYIIIMTVLSSAALVLNDYNLRSDPGMQRICNHLEVIFIGAFGMEMIIKIIGYGFIAYLKSPWRILDATIVLVSSVDIIMTHCTNHQGVNLALMRIFRTLRCLRILRTANVWHGFKLTINALFRSLHRLVFAVIIVIIVWVMFALISTSLFSQKFHRCVDAENNVLNKTVVRNKNECLAANYSWVNKRIHFDSTPAAMLALLEISVFKGWIDIFQDISNAPAEIDDQPDIDNNSSPLILIYILFIIIGSFFMIGMLIGVIVDSFEDESSKQVNVMLTINQKKLKNTLKQCLMFPLKSEKPRPEGWLGRSLYQLNNTIYVEVFYLVLILASTVIMALQYHPGRSQLVNVYLTLIDDVILLCFVLELVMKILAEGSLYLVPLLSWNLMDFIIVMLSVVAKVCNEAIDLQYLRVVRFARVFRMGRLLARSINIKTVRDILLAMITTLPSMLNVIALLIMAICIFSIIGVSLFNDQPGNDSHPFNELFNFRTFVSTWRMLFIVSTAAGFNDYLDGTMRFTWPFSALGVVFWVTYLCLAFFVLTNLIVSAVVSSYNEVFDNELSMVRLQTAETFTTLWNDFDQRGTGRMHVRHVSELLDLLSEPLRVPQPNTGVVSFMKIDVSEDYHVCHTDMVRALVKEIMKHLGHMDLEDKETDLTGQRRPLMDTMVLNKLRFASNVVKAAWWQRKLRHAAARLDA